MQEVATAKMYAQRIKKKAADPERKGSGWWRMEDLKAAFKRFADNPDDPEASFFMGKALQMAGQTDDADDRFETFAKRCRDRFGSHDAAVAHYDAVVAATPDADARAGGGRPDPRAVTRDDYRMMRAALERVEAARLRKAKRRCVVS